jgi:pyruvate/2-oxoacid:ferredoxin oxidoreductase alpha subunit
MYNSEEAVNFLEYNAEREHLIIPEYGRHLQKLIEQAVALEEKEERNKAARYIITVMGSLNPHLRDVPDFLRAKYWY